MNQWVKTGNILSTHWTMKSVGFVQCFHALLAKIVLARRLYVNIIFVAYRTMYRLCWIKYACAMVNR